MIRFLTNINKSNKIIYFYDSREEEAIIFSLENINSKQIIKKSFRVNDNHLKFWTSKEFSYDTVFTKNDVCEYYRTNLGEALKHYFNAYKPEWMIIFFRTDLYIINTYNELEKIKKKLKNATYFYVKVKRNSNDNRNN